MKFQKRGPQLWEGETLNKQYQKYVAYYNDKVSKGYIMGQELLDKESFKEFSDIIKKTPDGERIKYGKNSAGEDKYYDIDTKNFKKNIARSLAEGQISLTRKEAEFAREAGVEGNLNDIRKKNWITELYNESGSKYLLNEKGEYETPKGEIRTRSARQAFFLFMKELGYEEGGIY